MKAKHIPLFIAWLKVMQALDSRLDATDFNSLYRLFKRSHDVS